MLDVLDALLKKEYWERDVMMASISDLQVLHWREGDHQIIIRMILEICAGDWGEDATYI